MYRYLAQLCPYRELAWDCATGNGQAAAALAGHFTAVVASDGSAEQIASATACAGVHYRVATAENSGLASDSCDLVTVAQALHWFDIAAFFEEVDRVLKPSGVLAVWCYENCRAGPQLDSVIQSIFDEVEDFWPPERQIVTSGYRQIEFPWPPLAVPDFSMSVHWTAQQMLGYLRTSSASRRYQAERSRDAIGMHEAALRSAWGDGKQRVSWPLTIRVLRR